MNELDGVEVNIEEKDIKDNKLVNIEKVGWIKINKELPIWVKYSNPRISYDNKYWYISVGIEK